MNIYLLTQTETVGYDTYASMVVVAESADEAKKIHPNNTCDNEDHWEEDKAYPCWATSPDNVTAILIGQTIEEAPKDEKLSVSFNHGIILSSFNAS